MSVETLWTILNYIYIFFCSLDLNPSGICNETVAIFTTFKRILIPRIPKRIQFDIRSKNGVNVQIRLKSCFVQFALLSKLLIFGLCLLVLEIHGEMASVLCLGNVHAILTKALLTTLACWLWNGYGITVYI